MMEATPVLLRRRQDDRIAHDIGSALIDGAPLRRLFDAMPSLVVIVPLAGPPVYVNPAARQVLGLGATERLDTLLEFRPPGFGSYLCDVVFPAAVHEGRWRGRTEFVTRSGDAVPVSEVSIAHTAADGSRYICTVAREITAQERAHDTLRQAEERTRFALEAAKAGVWEVDLQTRRVTWSESMRAVQGFSNEEFGGTLDTFLALVHPADRQAIAGAMEPTTRPLRDFKIEFRALWPDGTTHWVESHGHVIADASGRPARILGMALDVTGRKQLEAELISREERYRLLFHRSLAGVYQSTVDGRLLDCNEAFARIVGYESREACLARAAADLHIDPAERRLFVERLLAQKALQDVETRFRRCDGATIWVSESATLIDEPGDGPGLIEGTVVDLTKRREVEVELRQTQKLESVGRLAAGVAHEINTPVQFVSDSVHFVREATQQLTALIDTWRALVSADPGATAETRAALGKAEEDADLPYLVENLPKALDRSLEGLDRVATIVRSMKEFAHPDQKEMTPVDLNRAIASTLVIARNEYKYVADVETDFGDIPRVTCRAGDVNQAVLNILINAAHAIGAVVAGSDRKGRIIVRTRQEGASVVVSISDSGAGIPEAIRDRIFEPFFTTKEIGKGTGQGLSIARAVIRDQHHGDLTFDTVVGVGTTFDLRLPIDGAARPEAAT
jgi:PAS domain S-box-containing protein